MGKGYVYPKTPKVMVRGLPSYLLKTIYEGEKMMFDIGFGLPTYLAHITIGVGRYTLWLNIVATNWKTFHFGKRWGDWVGCFSVFTFAYTRKEG